MKQTYIFIEEDTGRHQSVDMIGDERNEMDELAWDELAEITGQEISSSNPGTWFLDDVIEE